MINLIARIYFHAKEIFKSIGWRDLFMSFFIGMPSSLFITLVLSMWDKINPAAAYLLFFALVFFIGHIVLIISAFESVNRQTFESAEKQYFYLVGENDQ